MPIIHELSPHVINLIAAGEVVERPASVAKELLENAIDAGATRIAVELQNGGISYLRITDNGCGMSHEDAPVAFHRHATSKLRHEDDLQAICTLGFRGEALAAIAAVSRIDLLTKQQGSIAGTHIHIEGGVVDVVEEAGCPEGTTIVIRDLFFNTPARMKFLKKDFTEAGYVIANVQQQALSHPEIAFTAIKDGKQVFSSDGKGKLLAPVFSVYGRDLSQNMLPVDLWERDGYSAQGMITKPHACRPNRSLQHFFVNGRFVRSRVIQAALEEAYRNCIITGKYPSGSLFVNVPPSQVDVNVHPAKIEVKFAKEKQVFEAVYIACKNALQAGDNTPQVQGKSFTPQEPPQTYEQQEMVVPRAVPVAQPAPQPTYQIEPLPYVGEHATFPVEVMDRVRLEVKPKYTVPADAPIDPLLIEKIMDEVPNEDFTELPAPPDPLPVFDANAPRIFAPKPQPSHEERVQDTQDRYKVEPKRITFSQDVLDEAEQYIGQNPSQLRDAHKLEELLRQATFQAYSGKTPEEAREEAMAIEPQKVTVAPEILQALEKKMPAGVELPIVEFLPPPPYPVSPDERATAAVRIVGEMFQTYILAEDDRGLIMIDKHAAHERVLFNKLREQSEIAKQALLSTAVVDVSAVQFVDICENLPIFDGLGFEIEPFGINSIAVRAVPTYITREDVDDLIWEIADKIHHGRAPVPDRLDDLVHSISCRAAIKAGKNSHGKELLALCETVLADENVRSCPHGRPVMVRLEKYEVDKMFKRVNQ